MVVNFEASSFLGTEDPNIDIGAAAATGGIEAPLTVTWPRIYCVGESLSQESLCTHDSYSSA
jgi:hypothetical protein